MTPKQEPAALNEHEKLRAAKILDLLRCSSESLSYKSIAYKLHISAENEALSLLKKLEALGKVEHYVGRSGQMWRIKIGGAT